MLLIVHFLLGYRQLQDIRYYRDDPVVHRLLGVKRLPDVATLSRTLAGMDYIPSRRQAGNQVYMLAAMLAHNLSRELQMMASNQARGTTEKRAPL